MTLATKDHPAGSVRWLPFAGRVTVVRHDPTALFVGGHARGVFVREADGVEVLTGTDHLFLTEQEAEAEAHRIIYGSSS